MNSGMLSSICWVPRGAPITKLPEGVDYTPNEDHMVTSDEGTENGSSELVGRQNGAGHPGEKMNGAEGADDGEEDELDVGQILAKDLNELSFHKEGEKDPYLAADPNAGKLFDEEELDDLTMRPTDALVISVKSGEDASMLEMHVFDDNPDESDDEGAYVAHTYVHHDIVLPALPLCAAYTRLTISDELINLVAVGMFTPGIDIWDVDRVNNLEPVASLGGFQQNKRINDALATAERVRSGRRRKKPAVRLKEDSHKDAVMCLSWNPVQREYLGSGSADKTVKIWDIESSHCACTLTHHSDKVQAISFHPSEASLLLSGSFDKTIQVLDVRDNSRKSSWTVPTDVETCNWGSGSTENIVVTTCEDGYVYAFDIRKTKDRPLSRWQAHFGPATSCVLSRDVPDMMITAGIDKMLKVWDVSSISTGEAAKLIYERKTRAGALFSLSLCPMPSEESNASPFVVAYGGSKGTLGVSDLAVESKEVRKTFLPKCTQDASRVIVRRAIRGAKIGREQKEMRKKEMGKSESNDDDDMTEEDGEGEYSSDPDEDL